MDIAGIQIDPVDLIALGVIAFFFVLGLIKGFTFQVVRLITVLLALALANRFAVKTEPGGRAGLADYLISWFPNQFQTNEQMAIYIAFFLIFVGIFILGTLLAFLLRALLKRLELRAYDRLLGGFLGVAVGAVCVIVVVSCFVFLSPDSGFVAKIGKTYTVRYSSKIIGFAKPFFPEALRDKITEVMNKFPSNSTNAEPQKPDSQNQH